jgi:hypothetical protein
MTANTNLEQFLKSQVRNKGCWIYRTSNPQSYTKIKYKGKQVGSHRRAYEIFYGVSVGRDFVLHKCDNPPCCNPHHLFLGTSRDNRDDCVKKGRQAKGENHGTCKLTESIVRKIRKEKISQVDIAEKYGIGRSQVSRIITKKGWKHVN